MKVFLNYIFQVEGKDYIITKNGIEFTFDVDLKKDVLIIDYPYRLE